VTLRYFLAAASCQVLAVTLVLPARSAHAAPAPATTAASSKGAVLGLDGDATAAAPLTRGLRKAFAARGIGGGDEMTLAELRLTMGCTGDAPRCLAEGGATLGFSKMAYGSVRPAAGGGWQLDLTLLEVATGEVLHHWNGEVGRDELLAPKLEATSERVAASLFGERLPQPEAAAPAPAAEGRLVWGNYSPRPAWKWAGLGVSAGLLVAGVVTGAVTSAMLGGKLRDDLVQAAEDSLTDGKPANDVDPSVEQDLCVAARAEPPGEPGTVTNAAVTDVCNRGDAIAATATGSWIATGILAVPTVIFTVLLFVHRERPAAARLRRHGVFAGASPFRGGAGVAAGFRF
jgi:hypothetical protein